ncbi:AraC family transcriptional regulator [Anaerocolumna sedimenticola]|uniref:AraC family transcriptional regulator n=1 Tax=Anaerocolumna sedimenticola TaxID=2696063 RepID=A0A6P1TUL2_9FIRM|nr:helix-turn-helix domain-containing protein [Anaerocolumna sedimenticola]QHQ63376.1 AraC family transcriptional regulator [Anaerocolumna sedimenticola]
MNSYVKLMNEVIEYIENNINDPLSVQEIAKKFYLSEFHFSRIFKIMIGCSIKQYVQGRKLTLVAEKLKVSDCTVTRAAMDYGYESPEVLSRAFKKQFGIAPIVYRKGFIPINMVEKANVVVRDIMNMKGSFALKNSFLYLEGTDIYGVYTEVNENNANFEHKLNSTGSSFALKYSEFLAERKLFGVVNCHEDESKKYTVFFGGHISQKDRVKGLKPRNLPEGWYACFHYYGDMLRIRNTFVEDLYRWIMLKEIELSSNGIGMLNIFNLNDSNDVNILVPIKAPD